MRRAALRRKRFFGRRGLAYVSQADLQRYMLEDLLGFTTQFLLLPCKLPSKASLHRFIGWAEAFDAMNCEQLPHHMTKTIDAMTHR